MEAKVCIVFFDRNKWEWCSTPEHKDTNLWIFQGLEAIFFVDERPKKKKRKRGKKGDN